MFSKNLKMYLARRGWNLKELAARSGLAVTTVSGYYRGKYEPSEARKAKIAAALGVEVAALDAPVDDDGEDVRICLRVSVAEAAKMIGMSPQQVMWWMQNDWFDPPIGVARKRPGSSKFSYVISMAKIQAHFGANGGAFQSELRDPPAVWPSIRKEVA